jgi:hypothetical protein
LIYLNFAWCHISHFSAARKREGSCLFNDAVIIAALNLITLNKSDRTWETIAIITFGESETNGDATVPYYRIHLKA